MKIKLISSAVSSKLFEAREKSSVFGVQCSVLSDECSVDPNWANMTRPGTISQIVFTLGTDQSTQKSYTTV